MKKLAAIITVLFFSASALWAAPPTGELAIGVASKYLWRGYELSRNSVVIQPSLTVSYSGLSASLWGNMDTSTYVAGGRDGSSRWNETDFTLSYTRKMGLVTAAGGYTYYALLPLGSGAPERPDSQEVFALLSLDTPLNPTLTVFKEVAHYGNWYVQLGLAQEWEISPAASLKIAATAGYLLSTDAKTYPKFDDDALPTGEKFRGFHDGNVTVSLPVKVAEKATVTPALTFVFPLTDAAKREMKGLGLEGTDPGGRAGSFLAGGITLSLGF